MVSSGDYFMTVWERERFAEAILCTVVIRVCSERLFVYFVEKGHEKLLDEHGFFKVYESL